MNLETDNIQPTASAPLWDDQAELTFMESAREIPTNANNLAQNPSFPSTQEPFVQQASYEESIDGEEPIDLHVQDDGAVEKDAPATKNALRISATTPLYEEVEKIKAANAGTNISQARFQEILSFADDAVALTKEPAATPVPDNLRIEVPSEVIPDGNDLDAVQLPKLPPNQALDITAVPSRRRSNLRSQQNSSPILKAPSSNRDFIDDLPESSITDSLPSPIPIPLEDPNRLQGPEPIRQFEESEYEELPAPSSLPSSIQDISEDASPDLLLQSARNAAQSQDLKAANDRFLMYLKKNPENAEVRFEFAGILAKMGRLNAAASQFEHLRAQAPGDPRYIRSYVDLLLQLNDNARAEPLLQQLIQYPDHQNRAAIELARIYSSTQRKRDAIAIYEKFLQYQFPKNADDQLKLAQLLNEINLPDRALEVLTTLDATNPMNARVVRELIIASARVGDPSTTMGYVDQLQNIQPENIGLRDQLAKQLHDEGFYQSALMVDQQILVFDPGYRDSLIRTANAHLQLYDPNSAIGILKSFAGHQADPEFLAAQGEYHSMLGEHADAFASYQRVLSENPDHVVARMGLGNAMMRSGQYRRAAAEFSKIQSYCGPCNGTNQVYLAAQLARARALARAGMYCEAAEIVQSVNAGCELANRDQVVDASLDVLSLAKNYSVGIELARNALNQACGRTRREAQLRSKLGLLMVRGGKYAAGLKEFEALEEFNTQITPERIYGTYRAHHQLGNPEAARESLFDHFGLLSNDTYLRVRVAELANEDCDCCLAQEVLSHLSRICGTNPMVGNRLGEACLQCTSCETTGNCAGYFQQVLEASPTNVQAMSGLARLYTRQGNFCEANRFYQRALQHTPENIGLIRESARMLNQWQGPQAASQMYNRATVISSGTELYDIAQASPGRVAELEQDYRSLSAMNSMVATEQTAKRLGSWRPLSAIQSFEGLAALEPTNEDALFEIAQGHSNLNRTYCAIESYQRLLAINPCHTEAKIALLRNQLELRPRATFFGDYRHERGRQDLVNIDRDIFGARLEFPIRDEDEFISVGYRQEVYRPSGAQQTVADVPFIRFQFKPIWPLLAWAQFDFNSFDRFDQFNEDRINFDVGFNYRYFENAKIRMRAMQENVFQNSESIYQDIYRTGFEVGHFWQPTQRFTVDAFLRYWSYSDDNEAIMGGIYTGYTLREGRRQVRWLTNFHAMFFDEGTIRFFEPFLDDALHPYFSPEDFGFVTGGLEWRNLCSCNSFKGGNQRWLQLFAGGRIDSEGAGYLISRGEYYHDISNRFTFRAYGELVRSSVYDLSNIGIELTRRF